MLSYITGNKESEEVIAKLMSNVFLRTDILDNLTALLVKSAQKALEDDQAHDLFVNFLLRIVYNQKLKEGILENLLYSPVRSFFTFGYGGSPNTA